MLNYTLPSDRGVQDGLRYSLLVQISGPENTFDETPESVSDEQRQISSELMQSMQGKIQEALEADKVQITDTYGDGRHVSIDVVSNLFEGQSTMKR